MSALETLLSVPGVRISQACAALGVPRATFYRHQQPKAEPRPRPRPVRALSDAQRAEVRDVLDSERFRDEAPSEVYATMLDEGTYLCSVRTMYRVLDEHDQVRERRQAARSTPRAAPQLVATAPNQVWSWDITWLRGFAAGVGFALYTIIDIFSRYVVGWMVASKESEHLAAELIEATCHKQGIARGQLALHSDRGPAMRSKTVAELLVGLGVEKSHSRPRTSDDNPFVEAHFKTLKYCPQFPDRFGSEEDARTFCRGFVGWYNEEHHHSGLALLTPSDVHHGRVDAVLAQRDAVLAAAYARHPERFVRGLPRAPRPPTKVWIGPLPEAQRAADPVSEPPPEAPLPVAHDEGLAALAGAVQGVPAGASAAVPGRGRERWQPVGATGEGASCQDVSTGIAIVQPGRADPGVAEVQ